MTFWYESARVLNCSNVLPYSVRFRLVPVVGMPARRHTGQHECMQGELRISTTAQQLQGSLHVCRCALCTLPAGWAARPLLAGSCVQQESMGTSGRQRCIGSKPNVLSR